MKFRVTFLEERATEIDATDIKAAEKYAAAMVSRLGGLPTVKLLSIELLSAAPTTNDKPPTPLGRPPSGTLGGGQMKTAEELPDVRAA